jgi:hypothetical protein
MANVAIWINPLDGEVKVTGFAWNDWTRPPRLTDDEFLTYAMERTLQSFGVSVSTPYRIVDEAIPAAKYSLFRAAWTDLDLTVDMDKARVLHMDDIRQVRNAELVKEDLNMLKALEAGDSLAQGTVNTKKQTLRDLPATFDITTDVDTPEKLKAKWPAELPERE